MIYRYVLAFVDRTTLRRVGTMMLMLLMLICLLTTSHFCLASASGCFLNITSEKRLSGAVVSVVAPDPKGWVRRLVPLLRVAAVG